MDARQEWVQVLRDSNLIKAVHVGRAPSGQLQTGRDELWNVVHVALREQVRGTGLGGQLSADWQGDPGSCT